METEQALLFKIACDLHGNVTLFEATPQCLHKNSVNVSVSRIACDCEYALLMSVSVNASASEKHLRERERFEKPFTEQV